MKKAVLFSTIGFLLGLGAPLGALGLLWLSPHPAFQLPVFITEEWRNNLFFFTYMLTGSCLVFSVFGFILGREEDLIRAQNEKLSLLVTRDPLTGLGNHRHLMEVLQDEFKKQAIEGHPLSCLMLDLDFFKKVNDSNGHPFGDEVLKHFAGVIRGCVREGDTAARYGGEEFFCVLPNCGEREAGEVAERIRDQMAHFAFSGKEGPLKVTVSIGIVTSGPRAPTAEVLLSQADQALYQAKHEGRNKVCSYAPPPGA
jgi:diguanylate cyclase (GGDEF)-like protein